jgi:hypothetical protein
MANTRPALATDGDGQCLLAVELCGLFVHPFRNGRDAAHLLALGRRPGAFSRRRLAIINKAM